MLMITNNVFRQLYDLANQYSEIYFSVRYNYILEEHHDIIIAGMKQPLIDEILPKNN